MRFQGMSLQGNVERVNAFGVSTVMGFLHLETVGKWKSRQQLKSDFSLLQFVHHFLMGYNRNRGLNRERVLLTVFMSHKITCLCCVLFHSPDSFFAKCVNATRLQTY